MVVEQVRVDGERDGGIRWPIRFEMVWTSRPASIKLETWVCRKA